MSGVDWSKPYTKNHVDNRYNSGYTDGMKTAISLPDPVFKEAEILAKRLGMSRSELYATAVAQFVATHREEDITAALNEVYSENDSAVDPALNQLQWLALPREEW